ncbi:MAG: adenosylcobinamide-GDP ribazoletransferase [Candidatus Binataceae bacterium]
MNSGETVESRSFLTELRLAVSFLTIIPVIDARPSSEEAVAASFAWFPLVGFAIGVALCFEDALLGYVFGQTIRSVLIILTLTIITGAVHLDGLADTADALGAGKNRERALDILRDSRIGTFGTAAIFFDLALKIFALAALAGSRRYAALVLAPGLARWAMVIVADRIDYLRSSGAGSTLLPGDTGQRLIRASVTAGVVLFWAFSMRAIGAAFVALFAAVAIREFYRRWIGGVTGDLIGACGEIAEVAVLIAMAS